MNFLYRLRKWWLCKKHGICPIHLCMMIAGGGYEPRWWCQRCQNENGIKHADRLKKYEAKRLDAIFDITQLESNLESRARLRKGE